MQFDSFSEFIAMGDYGLYVWSAYVVSLLAMLIIYVLPMLKRKSLKKELQKQRQRAAKLAMAKNIEGTL